jgi:hypothetical protein
MTQPKRTSGPNLFGPLVFGVDRLPQKEAETAPAWPSLATVQRRADDRWERVIHPARWDPAGWEGGKR